MGLLTRNRLENIRNLWNSNYRGQNLVPELLGHIDALEARPEGSVVKVRVGAIEATVDAGPDGKLGTEDDKVKLKRAPAKKKAAKKNATAKKK